MLRNLLICGLIAGLCGGLLATGFARVVGEPAVDQAIAFEEQAGQPSAPHDHEEAPVVSRAVQKSFGLLTAASSTASRSAASSRSRSQSPTGASGAPARRARRILLAAAAFVVVFLVPFVKYPANPPAVGDPDTITKRTAAYLVDDPRLAARRDRRGAPARACWPSAGRARPRRSSPEPAISSSWSSPGSLLPSIHEVPKSFPAETLYHFREASIGMQASSGRRIGLVFAGTAQRVMTGQTIIPRRRAGAPATADD